MKSKYFGILSNENNPLQGVEEENKFLLEKELIEPCGGRGIIRNTFKTNNIGEELFVVEMNPGKGGYEFTYELVEKVYEFLINHYQKGLKKNSSFSRDFENETFGFLELDKRKLALSHFNSIYTKWDSIVPVLLEYDQIGQTTSQAWMEPYKNILSPKRQIVLASTEGQIVNENRFETLKRVREHYQFELMKKKEIGTAYLKGDVNYFNRNLFDTDKLILEIFQFENDLLILIDLNNRFLLTEDKVFSPKSIAQIIFQDYSEEFNSLKQLEFIEQQLSIETNKIHSFIVSLFYFFKKELKIKTSSAKLFQEIINSFFNCNIGGIKLGDPTNRKHEIRISEIHQDWIQFDEKRR